MIKLWMAPHGLHIEPARPHHAPALAKLHALGFYRGWSVDEFAAFLADPATPGYVACNADAGKIAGFGILRLAGDEAEVLTVAVDPKWRRKGVGLALMRAFADDLLLSPTRTLFLEVDNQNAAALALYRKQGFKPVGERKGYYPRPDGSAATAVVMALALG